MKEERPYLKRLEDAVFHVRTEYYALWNTARDHKEGRNVLLNVLQRETNVDKAAIAKYLNEKTDISYALRKKKSI